MEEWMKILLSGAGGVVIGSIITIFSFVVQKVFDLGTIKTYLCDHKISCGWIFVPMGRPLAPTEENISKINLDLHIDLYNSANYIKIMREITSIIQYTGGKECENVNCKYANSRIENKNLNPKMIDKLSLSISLEDKKLIRQPLRIFLEYKNEKNKSKSIFITKFDKGLLFAFLEN